MNGYDKLLVRLAGLVVFKCVRFVFCTVQRIYWLLNGRLRQQRESGLDENYDRCIHVMNIIAYYSCHVLIEATRSDYILTHNRFDSPDYIFNNDHVTLMSFDDKGVIFVESLPGRHLWKSECNSFYRAAQVAHGQKLLFVPMKAFLKMTEKLEGPSAPIMFLFNTARCGSTLLTNLLEQTDCCVTFSEPTFCFPLTRLYQRLGNTKQVQQVTKACFNWLCRHDKTLPFQPKAYVIKPAGPAVFLSLQMLRDLYPTSRYLFMYRGLAENIKSMCRLHRELANSSLACLLGRLISPRFVRSYLISLGIDPTELRMDVFHEVDLPVFRWVHICRRYLELRRENFPIAAVLYEDLVKNKEHCTRIILEYLGLPVDPLVDKALRAFQQDSQLMSPIARHILKKIRVPEMSSEDKQRANQLLNKWDLPLYGSDEVLEGTITH